MITGCEACLSSNIGARSARGRRAARAAARGVTLIEVLIVVAIMAVIAGGAAILVIPEMERSRVRMAIVGASTIKEAVKLHLTMGAASDADECPTMQALVDRGRLEKGKTDDPWGSPYRVVCENGEIHVVSRGRDRKVETPDDVRDDTPPSEVEALAKR